MTCANGVKGKFKFESNILKGSGTDFKFANKSLLEKIGIQKGSAKNAEGFYQKGNYRWNGEGSQF